MRILKSKRIRFLGFLSYMIIYELLYHYLVSKVFGYAELIYRPNYEKMIISKILFLIVVLMPRDYKRVSGYLIDVFLLFTIIPMLSMYWQSDRSTLYVVVCTFCYILMSAIVFSKNNKQAWVIKLGSVSTRIPIDWVFVILVVLLLVAITLVYGFATTVALDMANVYTLRSEQSFSGIWGYIINWLPYSIIPCLICISIYKKKYVVTIIGALCQIYLYLLTGSKSALFSVGLILMSYWLVSNRKNFSLWWGAILSGLSLLTSIIYTKFGILMPFAIIPVRLLSLPAAISNLHYEFFSNNHKLFFSENFIGRLFGIKSPYNVSAGFLIGGTSNSNTGFLGEAYDNAGIVLMIIYSILFAFILRYIDRIYNRVESNCGDSIKPVFVGILTYSMIYINDGGFLALIITGGLFINILFLMQLNYLSKGNER